MNPAKLKDILKFLIASLRLDTPLVRLSVCSITSFSMIVKTWEGVDCREKDPAYDLQF